MNPVLMNNNRLEHLAFIWLKMKVKVNMKCKHRISECRIATHFLDSSTAKISTVKITGIHCVRFPTVVSMDF